MNKNRTFRKTTLFAIAMAIALIFLSGFAMTAYAAAAAPDAAVSNAAELIGAVNAAPAGPVSYTIALKNDIELTGTLTIPVGKNIILISEKGGPFKLIGAENYDTITVLGKLTLGTTDLDGIIVTHIETQNDGRGGSGVLVETAGLLIMNSGEISGNIGNKMHYGDFSGGGVYVSYEGFFEMYGGTIENNNASFGGGVFVAYLGIFQMYGGKISDNTAFNEGGGVFVADGSFEMYGGTIANNIAQKVGGGVFLYALNLFKVPADAVGVVFSNNSAAGAYDRDPKDDGTYATYIVGDVTWSDPFTQGYNNYDIGYKVGTPLVFYTLSFDANAGDDDVKGLMSADKPILFNKPHGILPELSRDGYVFEGWFTEAEGGEKVNPSTIVTTAGDFVLYAQWTVYVDTGGGSGNGGNGGNSGSGFGQAVITENSKNEQNENGQNDSGSHKKTSAPPKETPGGDSKDTPNTNTGSIRGALFWVIVLLAALAIAARFIIYKNKNKV
ncbi:MAG: InlB B-repeat-containing protein [Methanimicrococcus sp.]|nr:InlB B-repeat-containing protein [Methanimicrococcus sp.]